MKNHDKIILAGELLLDAANIYHAAKTDAEFAKCILLAGAVIGISAPLLSENSIVPSQEQRVDALLELKKISKESLEKKQLKKETGKAVRFSRLVYNSLKHSGDERISLKASDDLTFTADLADEAYYIIGNAIDDFSRLPLSNKKLSLELYALLQTPWI